MFNSGIGRKIENIFPGFIDLVDWNAVILKRAMPFRRSSGAMKHDLEVMVQEDTNSDHAVMARASSILKQAIDLGKAGQFTVVPEFLTISATENCNLKCTMCPGHSGLTGPKLSVEQAESLFGSLSSNHVDFGKPAILDMTAGEPFMNNQLHLIFRKFKDNTPNSKIFVISNATFPIKGRVREAFELADEIGLSIDGATKETYERIRKGSVFENVIRNIRDVADLVEGTNKKLSLLFVVMDENIHELAAMVRLTQELGISELFAQAVEIRSTPFLEEGDNINLETPAGEIGAYLNEAYAEAERLNVLFNPTEGLKALALATDPKQTSRLFGANEPQADPTEVGQAFIDGIRLCNIPWFTSPRVGQDRTGTIRPTTVCCHMPNTSLSGNLENIKDFRDKSINYIYNSDHYWNIRQGLLDGTIANDACRGCQYYKATQWTPDQVRALEASVEIATRQLAETESYANAWSPDNR